MKNQELLNTINTLAGTIDPLIRSKDLKALETVIKKLLEKVEKL